MVNLKELSKEQLEELAQQINIELESRKTTLKFNLETDGFYDARKHGGAYVAIVTIVEGKPIRSFLDMTNKVWDSKRKFYKASWTFEAKEGDKLEARLTDGSWKNDYRSYFEVIGGQLKTSNREAVLGL